MIITAIGHYLQAWEEERGNPISNTRLGTALCGVLLLPALLGALVPSIPTDRFFENMVTVNGIFLSVLMASFGQFTDLLGGGSQVDPHAHANEKEMAQARLAVRRLLFAANSLAVVISLIIVVLSLIFGTLAPGSWDDWLSFRGVRLSPIRAGFGLYVGLLLLNIWCLFSTISILSGMVFREKNKAK